MVSVGVILRILEFGFLIRSQQVSPSPVAVREGGARFLGVSAEAGSPRQLKRDLSPDTHGKNNKTQQSPQPRPWATVDRGEEGRVQ